MRQSIICCLVSSLSTLAVAQESSLPQPEAALPYKVGPRISTQHKLGTAEPVPGALPSASLRGREGMDAQLNAVSAFDLINEKRELRFKWRGSQEGLREHSLKLRVSRNRSSLMWEAKF